MAKAFFDIDTLNNQKQADKYEVTPEKTGTQNNGKRQVAFITGAHHPGPQCKHSGNRGRLRS